MNPQILRMRLICNHEGQLSLWPRQASCALYPSPSGSVHLFNYPQRTSFFVLLTKRFLCLHLNLPVQIMRQHAAEQIDLVSCPCANRDIIHRRLILEFADDAFLIAASLMKTDHRPQALCFVRDDHLRSLGSQARDSSITDIRLRSIS